MRDKNPFEKYFKTLSTKVVNKTILNEETGEKIDIRVRTNISRIVEKNFFGKKETFIKVESVIYYDDKVQISSTKVKI